MKIKTLLILIFLPITVATIAYINYGIQNFGLSFHTGKDGGYFVRFESILVLSTIFYTLNAIHPKRKLVDYFGYAFAGFFIGIITGIGCYIILPLNDSGLTYHIFSVCISYISIYLIRIVKRIITKKASAE